MTGGAPRRGLSAVAVERFDDCSPVFIVGNGRSGSTLLRLMLDAHPNLALLGEVHFLNRILMLAPRLGDLSRAEDRRRLFELLPQVDGVRFLANAGELFRAAAARLDREPQPTWGKLYRSLLEQHARSKGARRFGDKSLEYVRHLPRLLAWFPRARIIHLVRDPRDVVESMLRMPWAPDDALTNAMKWRANVWCGWSFARRSRAVLEVRYEDLVATPQAVLGRICEFLGEPYDPRMLRWAETGASLLRDEPWKLRAVGPLDRGRVDRWRTRLSPARVAIVERTAGFLLDEYRYPRAVLPRGTRLAWPAAAVRELALYARYRLRRARARREGTVVRAGESLLDTVRLVLRSRRVPRPAAGVLP